MLNQQAAHAELNAVAGVGGNAPLPEWFGHHAKHGAAVELLPSGLDGVHAVPA